MASNERPTSSPHRVESEKGRSENPHRSLDELDAEARFLYYFAKQGNAEMTRYWLERGCYVNAQDSEGKTALMMAVANKHEEVVDILLSAGADISLSDHENKNALHLVCAEHQLSSALRMKFLQKLRDRCSSSEETALKLIEAGCHLYQAAYAKDAKILECMLERGAPVDSAIPDLKVSALHIAIMMEDSHSVKVLLDHGADVNAKDIVGFGPLFEVYRWTKQHSLEKVHILRLLLCATGSPTTVLQVRPTLRNGNAEAVRLVLSHLDFTAQGEAKDSDVLHYLAVNSNPGVVDELKVHLHKCNVNALEAGLSPLQSAAIHGNVRMLEFLLDHGADVNHADVKFGRTALYYAYARWRGELETQYDRCVETLLRRGADPQFVAIGDDGRRVTLFDVACDNWPKRLQPAIARLAMLEQLDTTITEATREKIGMHDKLKLHYNECRRILKEEIDGSATLLKLLSRGERNLERYVGNECLVMKLKSLEYEQEIGTSFPYYYDLLKRRLSKAMERKKLTDGAAATICEIFGNCIDRTHVIVGRVNDYLNDEDIRQLCQLANVDCYRVLNNAIHE